MSDELAIRRAQIQFIPHEPGEKYRPSNGEEGYYFDWMWCEHCKKDACFRETAEGGCEILARTGAFMIEEPEYPTEWKYGEDRQPMCTAFEEAE